MVIRILSIIDGIKVILNNDKKIVEVRVKDLKQLEQINNKIDSVKQLYKDYFFLLTWIINIR